MFKIFNDSLQDFKASYKQYLSFELIFMILSSFIFVPFISFMFNRMLTRIMGTSSLLNADVYKIGLSYTGVIGMLFISFLAVIILFVEFGVHIIIAQKRYFNKDIFVSEAFMTTVRKLPKLFGFGMFQLIPVLMLLIPFIDSSTLPALLDFNVPIFLMSELHQSYLSIVMYSILVLIFFYLFIRLLFTLPSIVIDGKSVWGAIKQSFTLTKYNKTKILITLCLLNLIIFLLGFLFVTFISEIAGLIDSKLIGDIVGNYLLTFSSYMMLIFSLLLIPINIIIIIRLFYQFKKRQGDLNVDHLKVQTNEKLTGVEKRIIDLFRKRKIMLVSIVIIYLTGMFALNYTVNESIVYLKWDVVVASHRGDAKDAPENSISSIRSAIEQGVDAVEIDVQITKDGVLVLNHDRDLQRVAGISAEIKDMTFEEVSQINLGQHDPGNDSRETIPTLNDVMKELKQEEIKLVIDIKTNESKSEIVENIVTLIEQHDMVELSYIQSFDNQLLQEVRNENPDIKIGQILYLAAGNLAGLDVDFYTIRQSMLTERFVKNARNQNREVWVWTVNNERNIKEVLNYDIDGIITDYPERVQGVLDLNFYNE